ncbi:MAG: tRNA preQ1(34) S-adenosylmethionine ribosyltransferase-isomerase QueA [Synechococcales cyanobacterium RU_4_20]|nr:tRNA preQ1(34) S-adenosylmethionine ribosyltransferase-isomerase QueA [Synechococcales cyanobacterium RU_4_20]
MELVHSKSSFHDLSPVSPPLADLQLANYDYVLPESNIAQNPVVPRDRSRLLVVEAQTTQHRVFRDLPEFLQSGDLLVMNNTRVLPARLYGQKLIAPELRARGDCGAKVEVLLLEEQGPGRWLALVKPGRRLKPGMAIAFAPSLLAPSPGVSPPLLTAQILSTDAPTGGRILQFEAAPGETFWTALKKLGEVPLPPYIDRSEADAEQYQTVYSDPVGAVAAPTAGLHFTPELLEKLKAQGIDQAFVTLHVGVGTFRPVEAQTITDHQMHGEWVEVSAEVVAKIEATKARGGRVFAVGTTAVRSLEGAAQSNLPPKPHWPGTLQPVRGKVSLFIYPGYEWKVVDGLITNFHLPKSSLMMLVSALVGRERLLALYEEAIAQDYRFYSFGDAMLILPAATTATTTAITPATAITTATTKTGDAG